MAITQSSRSSSRSTSALMDLGAEKQTQSESTVLIVTEHPDTMLRVLSKRAAALTQARLLALQAPAARTFASEASAGSPKGRGGSNVVCTDAPLPRPFLQCCGQDGFDAASLLILGIRLLFRQRLLCCPSLMRALRQKWHERSKHRSISSYALLRALTDLVLTTAAPPRGSPGCRWRLVLCEDQWIPGWIPGRFGQRAEG